MQAAQMLFEQSQASFDPNNIMALLQQHPYHVDSLLTMHELYRFGLLISSCIHTLCLSQHFTMLHCDCRLFVNLRCICVGLLTQLFVLFVSERAF